jgi:hypothetical protein
MTRAQYLTILAGLEGQLRRHADVAGCLLAIDPNVQDLCRSWDKAASGLREEYPGEPVPIPFWKRTATELNHQRFGGLAAMRPLVLGILNLDDRPLL